MFLLLRQQKRAASLAAKSKLVRHVRPDILTPGGYSLFGLPGFFKASGLLA
jgi:hypothetical protein